MDPTATTPAAEAAELPPSSPELARAPAKGKKKRKRKPLTPEQRQSATERQALNRKLERLFSGGDPEAMAKVLAALDGEPAAATAPEKPVAVAAAAPAPADEQPAPGWPTKEATARAMPLAQMAVQAVALAASLAGVDLAKPRVLGEGQEPVLFTQMLTDATAPVLALYAPDFLNTPLGVLGATCLMVASVCLSEAMLAKSQAESAHARPVPQAAGQAAPAEGARA